jgi:uncharacterized protein with HEPN domain
MSRHDPDILLEDILTALDKIGRFTKALDKARFLEDERTIDAVVRNLEVVGEAVRQLPEPFKDSHPQVPWWQIAGLRNRIVHDYFGVDVEIIWQVVSENVPKLKKQIVDLLGK